MSCSRFVLGIIFMLLYWDGNGRDTDASLTPHTKRDTQEHVLYRLLMSNYEPSVRPVKNHTTTLNVFFRMKLTQVLELSEKEQVLTTSMWIEQQWIDDFLKWDIQTYDGIRSLRMPSARVWLPDTHIYNSASSSDGIQGTVNGPYVMIHHDGLIKYPVPMKLKSNCEVDITYFPFDQQICYIKFASWIHDLSTLNFSTFKINAPMKGSRMSMKSDENENKLRKKISAFGTDVDLTGYVDNSGWILMNVTLIRREREHYQGRFPELVYFIHVKRRYLYYVFNVIIPCAMLSMLTCMSFWLPCLSGEKVSLGLTCFVAYSVFMLMVAEKVPATSETVPIISVYLTIVMSFTSISVIMAVIVTNIHEKTKNCHGEEHRLPKCMRQLFVRRLARFFNMEKSSRDLLKLMLSLEKREKVKRNAAPSQRRPSHEKDAAGAAVNGNGRADNQRRLPSFGERPSSGNVHGGDNDLFAMITRDLIARKTRKESAAMRQLAATPNALDINGGQHFCCGSWCEQHHHRRQHHHHHHHHHRRHHLHHHQLGQHGATTVPNNRADSSICLAKLANSALNDCQSQNENNGVRSWASPFKLASDRQATNANCHMPHIGASPVWLRKQLRMPTHGGVTSTYSETTDSEVDDNRALEAYRQHNQDRSPPKNASLSDATCRRNYESSTATGLLPARISRDDATRHDHADKKQSADNQSTSSQKPTVATTTTRASLFTYRIKRENISLYYSYEWVLAGLVLDRLFFWLYAFSTLVSCMLTLFVFPFVVQKNKYVSSIEVP